MDTYILLTNDDGVMAPGLLALKRAMERLGEVVVFAPQRSWSASGHTKTMHKPLRVEEVTLPDGARAYATNGTPSDCVALALLGLVPRRPDLVVSGINQGANVGHDITYSGTVAAAMEAVIFGVPAFAISLDAYEGGDFGLAAEFAAHLASLVLERGLPSHALLNVNVPDVPPEGLRGVRLTRLGRRIYRDVLIKRQDPRGRSYYWIGGEPPTGVVEEGTDIGALAQGYISITPLHLDMTDYQLLKEMKGWGLESMASVYGGG